MAVKNAAQDHKLTGILNPFSGPNVDQSANHPADLNNYQYILHTYLGKGTIRPTPSPAEGSPTPSPADDGDPTDGIPQRALQSDGLPNLTVRKYLLHRIGWWGRRWLVDVRDKCAAP